MPSSVYPRAPLNLTFGIELECTLWYDRALSGESTSTWEGRVSQVLGESCLGEKVEVANSKSSYNRWKVDSDVSVNDHAGKAEQLELISRVLPFDQAGLDEARTTIESLGSSFRVTNDASTGLHVHVGNGIYGFPLRTLQNLSLLWVGFEHLWNSLHPDCRALADECGRYSSLFSQNDVFDDIEPGFARMLRILQTETFEELCDTLHPPGGNGRYCTINILPMSIRPFPWGKPGHTRTVEFRQHKGTSDPAAILNWVEVVVGLVKYAHEVSEGQLANVLCRVADARFTILDLLEEIGCDNLVVYYGGRLHLRGHSLEPFPQYNKGLETAFLARMEARESSMLALDASWLARGLQSLHGVHRLSSIPAMEELKNSSFCVEEVKEGKCGIGAQPETYWYPWNDVPFDCPWDADMAKWSGIQMPESWHLAVRLIEDNLDACNASKSTSQAYSTEW